jgi:glycogen operon protein
LTVAALAAAGPAAVRLGAAAVGSSHPASGAYSPVNQPAWGTAAWPLGATFTAGPGSTLEVGVYSANATNVVMEIYLSDTGADAAYDYTMAKGPDNIWRAAVAGAPAYTLYAFRAWGPNWPLSGAWARGNSSAGFIADYDAQGNRFNPNKVLFDPYARELSHNTFTPAMQAAGESYAMYTSGGTDVSSNQTYTGPLSGGAPVDCRIVDTGHWAPKAVAFEDHTPTGPKPGLSQEDAIIYEAHVKGLTAHPSSVNLTALLSPYSGFQDAANVPDGLRGTYAGAASMAGYLKDLGFNTVEFLPVHETDNAADATTAPTTSGGGYWGYWTYGFFAPDRRYASNQSLGGPTAEFKAMVASFHQAGIEVYLDVVYNHSGEGGVWDSSTAAQAEITFFRGLDNQSYYTLVPGTPQFYWVSTGVGTNVNGGSAPVQQLVADSLTYWATTMGVDGFRFDEAAELGRDGPSNFSGGSPLLLSIASLASSQGFKIIAEPWDGNDGGEIGNFPPGWACWNGNYRDSIRLYMQGNITGFVSGAGGLGYADAFYGDTAKMSAEGGPQKSVNYIVCHDGFNMTDVVSYGTPPANLAWPFGPELEGGADNSFSFGGNQALRRQIIRDYWTFQVLSRGVPMMVWGDELGRTVDGNNNSYNIDSVATWNNYGMLGTNSPDTVPTGDTTGGTMGYDNDLGTFASSRNGNFAFLQYLLRLRGAHPAFRQKDYTSENIAFTNADGSSGFSESLTPSVEIYVHGSQVGDDDFIVLSNLSPSSVTFAVPAAPAGAHWVRIIDTGNPSEGAANSWSVSAGSAVSGTCAVGNQAIAVLEAAPASTPPQFTTQPSSQTVAIGTPAVFHAEASGSPDPTYQWYFNGTTLNSGNGVSGTTGSTLVVSSATAANAGNYYCVASNSAGSLEGNPASLAVSATPDIGRLVNISCRAQVGTGANILITGFAVGGAGTSGKESLLIRGSGPALAPFGVAGVLPDPQLQIYSGSQLLGTNDGWAGDAQIASAASAVGAFPWASSSSHDSALLESSPAGAYTAQIAGQSNDTGVALAEVYDATPAGTYTPADPRLVNISARVQVGSGGNILIAGFVIGGSTAETILVRASGPALAAFGVAGPLSDPQLKLYSGSTLLGSNDGWGGDAEIVRAAASVGAFQWSNPLSNDSAILVTLSPGAYTAQVSGASGDSGVALVEVYEVP